MANDMVLTGIEEKINDLKRNKEFHFPANYSPENALKSAWLILQTVVDKDKNKALTVCEPDSIKNAIFDMVIQGLSPAKKQCYFLVYGKQLVLQRSYFGTMAVTKRCSNVQNIDAQVVYVGDDFEYGYINGVLTVTKHIPNLDNVANDKIRAAYCVVIDSKGTPHAYIMTIKQLHQAWAQSKAYPFDDKGILKSGSVQFKFGEEMAKKTVINRGCKYFLNTSDDADLFIDAVNRTTENEYEKTDDIGADIPKTDAQEAEVVNPPDQAKIDAIELLRQRAEKIGWFAAKFDSKLASYKGDLDKLAIEIEAEEKKGAA